MTIRARWPEPYTSISKYDRGTFGWAMDQLEAGNEVRRWDWPIERWPCVSCNGSGEHPGGPIGNQCPACGGDGRTKPRIWKLYRTSDYDICKGFSSGVVGADLDSWGDLGMASGIYRPSDADRTAKDWQTTTQVSAPQIEYLDTHRMQRWPNQTDIDMREELARKDRAGWVIVSIIFGLAFAFAAWWWRHG